MSSPTESHAEHAAGRRVVEAPASPPARRLIVDMLVGAGVFAASYFMLLAYADGQWRHTFRFIALLLEP